MRRKFSPDVSYGDWTVSKPAARSDKGDLRWLCRCFCGQERIVLQRTLLAGTSTNCGCRTRYAPGHRSHATHGATVGGYTPEYRAWLHMRTRCNNPNVKRFEHHGGRGIRVCERWQESFEAFFEDMGPRPSARHSVDRIDNDGHYEPGNCRWATPQQQQGNKSDNVYVLLNGERKALKHACDEVGIAYSLVHCRLRRGWTLQEAVSKPVGPQGGSGRRSMSSIYTAAQLVSMFAFAGAGTQTFRMLSAGRAA